MSCVVPGCNSHSLRKENNPELLTFHRFPRNKLKLNIWVNLIGRQNGLPISTVAICSNHFTPDSFASRSSTKWRRLLENAVPTLFTMDVTDEMEQEIPMEICEERHIAFQPIQGTEQHRLQPDVYLIEKQMPLSEENNKSQNTAGETCKLHEAKISRLQRELERVKKVSQRRLKKINTLTKRLQSV